jgi:hypothetical protein
VDEETRRYADERIAEERRRNDEALSEQRRHNDEAVAEHRQRSEELVAENRRFFGVLEERLRHDLRIVAEGVALNAEAIERLRQEMNAQFTSERAFTVSLFNDLKQDIAELRPAR